MKECFKCKKTLPLSDFYAHPRMGDGHLGKCKRCTKVDVRANYRARHERYLQYDHMRNKNPERIKAIKTSANKDPLKAWARRATHLAIKKGLIARGPCEVCGNPVSDAHHADYRRPIEVRWLCRQHHMEEHHPLEQAG
jgi:hypothetical protein